VHTQDDPVEKFLGGPLPAKRRLSEADVPHTSEGVRALVGAGSWRAVSTLSQQLLATSHPVDELLRLRWFRIMSMLKLRDVATASREMGLLGDLLGPGWMYEKYPTIFPQKRGSMVPFALLLLHALMPAYSGDHAQTLQRLYALFEMLRTTSWPAASFAFHKESGKRSTERTTHAASEGEGDTTTHHAQRCAVLVALVNTYCAAQDYPLAIAHLKQMLAAAAAQRITVQGSEQAVLHSLLGRVHIQVGNLDAAEDAFNKLECLLLDADSSADVRLNRGFLSVARGEYEEALEEFNAALELEPANSVAANNVAVCLLYCCRLSDAIKSLEEYIKGDPARRTTQALLSNLSVLYQMVNGGAAAKQTLEQLGRALGPDELDVDALLSLS